MSSKLVDLPHDSLFNDCKHGLTLVAASVVVLARKVDELENEIDKLKAEKEVSRG